MSRGRLFRLAVVVILLSLGFFWIHRTSIDSSRITLYMTAVIGSVTAVYALLTYEILLQNQAMAQAAVDSTKLTERGLRFSYTPNLLYKTLNTKDPEFRSGKGISPIDNEDYRNALAEQSTGEHEFVFAVIENVGHGAATNLKIDVEYKIVDSSNLNKKYVVPKQTSVQILQPGKAVALCIFFFQGAN
jgi:hypothetical protein